MTDSGDRAREEFLSEAQEIVENLGRDLLALDEAHRMGRFDPDLINDIFRAVHTLKGLAGLFAAAQISTLSHELEDLLDNLRLGRQKLDTGVLDLLFRSIDLYARLLSAERDGREEPAPELEQLLADLGREDAEIVQPSPLADFDLDPNLLAVLTEYEEHRLRTNIADGLQLYRLRVTFQLLTIDDSLSQLKVMAKPHGEIITYLPTGAGSEVDSIELDILIASRSSEGELRAALASTGATVEPVARKRPTAAVPRRPTGASPQDFVPSRASGAPKAAPNLPPPPGRGTLYPVAIRESPGSIAPPPRADDTSLRSVSQTVRVDIRRLDQLMNIVGELSIVRSSFERLIERVRQSTGNRELSGELLRLHRSFERNVALMQERILEVRMVPLGQVFDKLARVVRQLSREANKQVNMVVTGAETEVDKLIVEELSDPLMHMMRNAIDHGIEPRQVRESVGKPEVGTIALNAFQKGNHVVIEIEDDGAGIDTEKLMEAAVSRGIVSPEDVRSTARRDILNLIFLPGLTTRSDVTEFSGRGVGMDVVKTNISKLGGVIDLQSEVGIGTKITITLPTTLAIISALIVLVGAQRFAIPLSNVQEAVVLDPRELKTIDGREVMTLRGQTLRLCRLADLFRIQGGKARQFVVVAAVGQTKLGFVVDNLVGGQDIVIKALGRSLRNIRGFAGAAELGDQHLALMLDAPALIEDTLMGDRSKQARDHG